MKPARRRYLAHRYAGGITMRGEPTTSPAATVLVVFGHGVDAVDGGYVLTPASIARVRVACDYVDALGAAGRRPRVVFTGGWPAARAGAPAPPAGFREGDLMLAAARAAGLDRHADLRAESRSRSTLENLVYIVEDGLLDGYPFDHGQPLGLVSHAWHLPRVRFLAGRVLGLRGAALLDVVATGGDDGTTWRSTWGPYLAARLIFLGARSPRAMLRRERCGVAAVRRVERLLRALNPRRAAVR
jgi:hypothetical protein